MCGFLLKRTFGIEEEFFLFNEHTFRLAPLDTVQTSHLLALNALAKPGNVQTEFLAAQIEIATGVCTDSGQAMNELRGIRQLLAAACNELGIFPAALGTPVLLPNEPTQITAAKRYQAVQELVPGLASEHYLSGMHIHIGIPDLASGIRALNGLRRWIPVLVALSSNSPYWRGQDSGFASWRTIQYRRWSINGIPPHFDNVETYLKHRELLLSSESLPDAGHIGWSARLSEKFPTLEFRASDVQLTSAEAVALAALMRALIDTVLDTAAELIEPAPELLQLALWQAARVGMQGNLLDLKSGSNTPAWEHVRRLLDFVRSALESNGDESLVYEALERWAKTGTGAQQQRAAWDLGGVHAVLDSAQSTFIK